MMKMKMNTNNMSRFVIRYRPDKHEGEENKSGKEYFYWLKLDGDYFTNAGKPVGFVAYDEKAAREVSLFADCTSSDRQNMITRTLRQQFGN